MLKRFYTTDTHLMVMFFLLTLYLTAKIIGYTKRVNLLLVQFLSVMHWLIIQYHAHVKMSLSQSPPLIDPADWNVESSNMGPEF